MAFYDTVRLEKGMYNTPGKSFTQVLEELDFVACCDYGFDFLDDFRGLIKESVVEVGMRKETDGSRAASSWSSCRRCSTSRIARWWRRECRARRQRISSLPSSTGG